MVSLMRQKKNEMQITFAVGYILDCFLAAFHANITVNLFGAFY